MMSSPSLPLSPPSESDITFTSIQSVLFDSPCAWRDTESSDSGFGSSDSESYDLTTTLTHLLEFDYMKTFYKQVLVNKAVP